MSDGGVGDGNGDEGLEGLSHGELAESELGQSMTGPGIGYDVEADISDLGSPGPVGEPAGPGEPGDEEKGGGGKDREDEYEEPEVKEEEEYEEVAAEEERERKRRRSLLAPEEYGFLSSGPVYTKSLLGG